MLVRLQACQVLYHQEAIFHIGGKYYFITPMDVSIVMVLHIQGGDINIRTP
jgi:hypothetical protein